MIPRNCIIISKSTSCTLAYKVQGSIIFNKYSAKETFPAVLKHDHTLYTYKQVTVRERERERETGCLDIMSTNTYMITFHYLVS